MEEFMTHLYGSRATQSLMSGGDIKKDIQDSISLPYQDRNMFKLCKETLGRNIGDVKDFNNNSTDVMKGGEFEAPKSYASIISELIDNMHGGYRKRKEELFLLKKHQYLLRIMLQ